MVLLIVIYTRASEAAAGHYSHIMGMYKHNVSKNFIGTMLATDSFQQLRNSSHALFKVLCFCKIIVMTFITLI